MNDDELDKLFELEEPDTNEEPSSEEKEGDTVEPEESVKEESVKEEPSEEKESKAQSIKEEDFKDNIEKEQEEKRKRKEEARKEKARQTAQTILAAENYFEEARKKRIEARRQKREEKLLLKKDLPPLKDRTFLDDFPLSFKHTMMALIGITVFVIVLMLGFHPMFRIENISIEGNYAMTNEEIIEATGLNYHDHMLKVLAVNYSDILASNPYIRKINISINFPSGINISVEERRKLAYIKYADGYFAIDAEGTVLELSSFDSEDAHPLLCGLDINNVVLGGRVDIEGDVNFQKLVIVLGAALEADQSADNEEYSFFENIREIRILPSNIIFVTVIMPNGSELQIKFSDIDTIGDDMHWLMFVIEQGKLNDLSAGVMDMTGDQPIYSEYDY
ncbi:MAG: FtsQ-type POTRA domain-containing protein [Saccharofermentans sp.]|nr:FtsQ-type POTRA domain-containing protein [Saccharofermentans sp.]